MRIKFDSIDDFRTSIETSMLPSGYYTEGNNTLTKSKLEYVGDNFHYINSKPINIVDSNADELSITV